MEKEFRIKGIEKIIEKISKEDLAYYFDADQDSDFEAIITENLRKRRYTKWLRDSSL